MRSSTNDRKRKRCCKGICHGNFEWLSQANDKDSFRRCFNITHRPVFPKESSMSYKTGSEIRIAIWLIYLHTTQSVFHASINQWSWFRQKIRWSILGTFFEPMSIIVVSTVCSFVLYSLTNTVHLICIYIYIYRAWRSEHIHLKCL